MNDFRTILQSANWTASLQPSEIRAFEESLRVSGYWNFVNKSVIDDSTTYTPPFHPSFVIANGKNNDKENESTHDAAADKKDDGVETISSSLSPSLSTYAKLLRCVDDETLANFVRYATINMRKSGLLSRPIVHQHTMDPSDLLSKPSLQLAFLLCMQHYFI
jgi:hypothetical protein